MKKSIEKTKKNLIKLSVEQFCNNPYWKEYYQGAPTNFCRQYIALKFYYSNHLGQIHDYEQFRAELCELEEKFVKSDWQHLYRYCANNPLKVYYRNKISLLNKP